MARTDPAYLSLTTALHRFYDFTEKEVLYVGAGGGQLLDPGSLTRPWVAVDQDEVALGALRTRFPSATLLAMPFEQVTRTGDVVYLEFCLHEMRDPEAALRHARTLAPEVVVFDHAPGSPWCFLGVEEDKVERSSAAIRRFDVRRREGARLDRPFRDATELNAKFAAQGPTAIARLEKYQGATDLVIPMDYELNLL